MDRRSNLAYRYDSAYRERGYHSVPAVSRVYAPNVRIKTRTTVKVQPKRKAKAKIKLAPILSILFVAAAACLVLYRGVAVTELCSNVEKKEKLLEETIAANQKTQLEIDSALDLKKVEEIATNELGMRRPEKYQTVYVSLNQGDYVEKVSGEKLSADKLSGGFFGTVKEYLD